MSDHLQQQRTTTSGRARLFPFALGMAIVGASFVAATQYVASHLGYQEALGEPIAQIGVPIYQPLSWLTWYMQYRTIDHPVLDAAFSGSVFIVFAGLIGGALTAHVVRYLSTRDLQKETPSLHGTAHWMPRDEVIRSGLANAGCGVYIGAWKDPKSKRVHYLRHDGPEHVMAIAPTRSGKGVGLVLPTLLSWPHSVVVHDMKGEAWAITAGWRQKEAGNSVLRFDPADPSGTGARYNPLEEVRLRTLTEVGDVQNLVTMIVDPDGKGLNDHWAKTGSALLVGAVLHVLYAEQDKTLCGVANFLSDPSRDFAQTLEIMLDSQHDATGQAGWTTSDGTPTLTHPVVAASARDMLNKADNERSGVLSTAMSFLALYRDPIVAANTRSSDFRIADLMNADKPVSLYLVVRPSDKDRLKPLIRLLMNQIVRGTTEHMEFKDGRSVAGYKHRLLLLIDEFPALGKLEILEEALAFLAGYGIKAYLIIQDKAQLEKHYGREESVTSNCHVRVAYAPNKIETAEMLSKMVGTTTVAKTNYGYSGRRNKASLDSISTSVQEVSRPLLTPDEIMRLRAPSKDSAGNITDAGDMLIFIAGQAPVLGTQILYFLDPTFSARSKFLAPEDTDRVRALPPPVASAPPATPLPIAAPAIAAVSADASDEVPPMDGGVPEDTDWESPPLPDSALADYGEPDDEDAGAAFAEGSATVIAEDEEPPLGAEIHVDTAELAGVPPLDDNGDELHGDESAGGASLAELAIPDAEPAPSIDDILATSRAWASGRGLDDVAVDLNAYGPAASTPAPAPAESDDDEAPAATAHDDPFAAMTSMAAAAD